MGNAEIAAGGLNYIHEDQQEREMEYEADHGNDRSEAENVQRGEEYAGLLHRRG